MPRVKEVRYTTIYFQDGFSGTGAVNDTLAASDTVMEVDTLDLHDDATIVPAGARFTTAGNATVRTVTATQNSAVFTLTIDATGGTFTLTLNGETTSAIAEDADSATVQTALLALATPVTGDVLVTGDGPHTITLAGNLANTAATLSSDPASLTGGAGTATVVTVHDGTDTWQVTFSPAIVGGAVPADDDVITWLPQRLEADISSGQPEYTVTNAPIFDLSRDILSGVRLGPEQPLAMSAALRFDWLKSSSGQPITPYEAMHRTGNAASWHNAAADPCEPYAIDILWVDRPPCGSEEAEIIAFRQFYPTSISPKFSSGLIEFSGNCPSTKPEVYRVVNSDAVIGAFV
jgi:hypothetical protein